MKKTKTVSFSGHRTLPEGESLEILKKNLWEAVETAIQEGYHTFLFGGNYGFELLAAEEVLRQRDNPPKQPKIHLVSKPIEVIAILPYEEQHVGWTEPQRDQYFDIMERCDDVITLQNPFSDDCYSKRIKYLAKNSTRMITNWDGNPDTITGDANRAAEEEGVTIVTVSLNP